jgi:hypothetical protein
MYFPKNGIEKLLFMQSVECQDNPYVFTSKVQYYMQWVHIYCAQIMKMFSY